MKAAFDLQSSHVCEKRSKQLSMYASSRKRVTESITTVPHILEVLEGLRSVHTRRQVAATCRGDAFHGQIASCVLENFVKIFVAATDFCRRKLFWDLLQRKNSVAETKIFTKILHHTRSDLSLRRVAATCCCNQSPDLYTWSDLSPRRVAATCGLVCTDLKRTCTVAKCTVVITWSPSSKYEHWRTSALLRDIDFEI